MNWDLSGGRSGGKISKVWICPEEGRSGELDPTDLEGILQAAVQLSFPEVGVDYRPFTTTAGSGGVRRRELILWDARSERRTAGCEVGDGHGQSHPLQAHRR